MAMCRNIHTLHNFEPAATSDEVHAAALQYVRKIAGTTKPSKANQAAFVISQGTRSVRRLKLIPIIEVSPHRVVDPWNSAGSAIRPKGKHE